MKTKGCVYFFRHIGLTPVKIGYTESESPIDRFNQFKTYAPYGSEILGFVQTIDAKELETALHNKYANKRLSGEWFEITETEVNFEVDFHSSIEDVRERNEFQQTWALYLKNRKEDLKKTLELAIPKTKKETFIQHYQDDKNLNRSHIADKIGVSRRTIITWINELENRVTEKKQKNGIKRLSD